MGDRVNVQDLGGTAAGKKRRTSKARRRGIPPVNWRPSPLMTAASAGDFKLAERLIVQGAAVHHTDWANTSVLMCAAEGGNLELVNRLIGLGCDVHAVDDAGVTTLMYAAMGGNLEIVKRLVGLDVDVAARDRDGMDARRHARHARENADDSHHEHNQHMKILEYLSEEVRREEEQNRAETEAMWRHHVQ